VSFLTRLFRKKKEVASQKENVPVPEKKEVTVVELKTICADDPEAYDALYDTMLLGLGSIGITLEEAVKKAKKLEAEGDVSGAYYAYWTAGRLALREGTLKQVKAYFGACARLKPEEKLKILEVPERAMKKAQEYYAALEAPQKEQ